MGSAHNRAMCAHSISSSARHIAEQIRQGAYFCVAGIALQGPDGDQDAAQVLDGLAPGRRVEQAVGEGRPGSQVPQDRGGGAAGQPARRRVRAFCIGESPVEGLKFRRIPSAASPSRSRSRSPSPQRAHRPAVSLPGCPQPGQLRQKPGPGRRHIEHSGSPAVPPRTGRVCPQPTHRAHRCWQAWHHGWPVTLDTSQGAVRPQIEHVSVLMGRQDGRSGPAGVRTLTVRRRPQPAHSSWLAALSMSFGLTSSSMATRFSAFSAVSRAVRPGHGPDRPAKSGPPGLTGHLAAR
jgi:hypothetical protein